MRRRRNICALSHIDPRHGAYPSASGAALRLAAGVGSVLARFIKCARLVTRDWASSTALGDEQHALRRWCSTQRRRERYRPRPRPSRDYHPLPFGAVSSTTRSPRFAGKLASEADSSPSKPSTAASAVSEVAVGRVQRGPPRFQAHGARAARWPAALPLGPAHGASCAGSMSSAS
jgi:hypothetical protein